jgi:hypothetical protein
MQYFNTAEQALDETVTQLVIKKEDNVVAFTLNNVGDVDFYYAAGVIVYAGTSKSIGGNNLVPFGISKNVKFADAAGYKMVVVEKLILVQE